ncbi:MAG: hypothetical protein RI958_2220, partial [Actinomycetota bacterium]
DEMRVQGAIKSVIAMLMVTVLALGGVGVGAGWVEVAGVVLAFRFVQIVRNPVEHLTWRLQESQGVAGAARRILDLVDERRAVASGSAHLPEGPLDVVFDDVGLVYDDAVDGAAALHSLDLRIAPGRVVGLIGRTGSGKTTVARLALRLVAPTSGQVRIGGVDVTTLDDDHVRERVVAIPQDVQLFPGTVRDNVTLFAAADDDLIMAALRDAGLGPWVSTLAAGLDTVLAADGRDDAGGGSGSGSDGRSSESAMTRTGLSAGQAQLLAIARALLRGPDLIVLDEATSRVDPVTQAMIGEAMQRLVAGRTALIIAHRLETLDVCDEIVVLADGRLVEHGRRTELASDPTSRYAQLRAVGDDAGELA